MFSPEARAEVDRVVGRYPKKVNALLPVLHIAQRENRGSLNHDWLRHVAEILECSPTHVEGVATFYTMFKFKPVGRHHLQVCTNISCGLCGGEKLLEAIEKKLHLHPGETSEDGRFSLEEVECLGACGFAPVMIVNTDYYENLTVDKALSLVDELGRK